LVEEEEKKLMCGVEVYTGNRRDRQEKGKEERGKTRI